MERRYSKSLAVANHVVWTQNEVIPVPYSCEGLVTDGNAFGFLRILGREVQCMGFRVDFRVPATSNDVQIALGIYTANDVLQGSRLVLNGVTQGGDNLFSPIIAMPSSSLWKFKIEVNAGADDDLPQGITATYLLRYANGPSNSTEWTANLPSSGVGYWSIGDTFEIL